MIQDYNGDTVVDATGERIGTVEQSYVDDGGTVRAVGVKIGTLRTKHRIVPVDGASREKDRLTVPYTKRTVEESPDADAGDTLEGEMLQRVRAYYAGAGERVGDRAPGARPAASQTRQPPATAQSREAPADDTREAETPEAAGSLSDEARELGAVRDLGDTIEVPIVEEEIVKRPVVKEVLRIRKSTVAEQQKVEADLRKEDIEIDREGDVEVRVEDRRSS